jgi:hypothetical protein
VCVCVREGETSSERTACLSREAARQRGSEAERQREGKGRSSEREGCFY